MTSTTRLLVLLTIAISAPEVVDAQLRRSADGAPPPPVTGTPLNRRFPIAGAWEGTIHGGPENATRPATIVFSLSDSAKQLYEGAEIMPNGGRAPYRDASFQDGTLRWKSPNSGGGDWVFTATLTGLDTLTVDAVLKGAPWNPSPEPVMTYLLTRRPVGK
jgi:hypothetical protein